MDYLSVTYPAGAKLGMSVVSREDPVLPTLGNTVVDSVDAQGLSRQGGVQQGDYILSVNEQYVAFEPNTEVVRLLKAAISEAKPLSIYFSRPNPFDWAQVQRSIETPVREGVISRMQEGLFSKKWQQRTLKVTRETLDFSSEGTLKNKYALESEVGRPRVAAGYPASQGVFELRCVDKDMVLQSNSTHGRNLWMHAIDCAKEKAFAKPLPAGSGPSPMSAQAQQRPLSLQPQPTAAPRPLPSTSADGIDAYLEIGRAALLKSATSDPSASAGPGTLARKPSSQNMAGLTAAYKVLSLSKVQAVAGPGNAVSLEGVQDPTKVAIALVDYDFKLENDVLARAQQDSAASQSA